MSARQKAKDMLKIALDERGDENVRVATAMKLLSYIDKHHLLDSPLDILDSSNEDVQAVKTIIERVTDPTLVDSVKRVAKGISSMRGRGGARRYR